MELNGADTAWVLVSTALVLLMTPGLAFFYGGMVRAKSVLNMLMMSFICISVVAVAYVAFGASLAFGPDIGGGLLGDLSLSGLSDLLAATTSGGLPVLVFLAFQLMFAIITPALISGAIADRARFGAWAPFVLLWVTFVYFPVAHWVFAFDGVVAPDIVGGWIANDLQAIDFAGGTAVHINAGAAALALTFVLGPRVGFRKDPMRPHSMPLVLIGTGLLVFGWLGFNAGSALAANGLAAVALLNTVVAAAAGGGAWIVVERLRDGHPTTLGVASGIVAGLVGITPAAASVTPVGAIGVGILCGVACAYAVGLKVRFNYDDSLDVVGIHLVGGVLGSLAVGLLAAPLDPLLFGGDGGLLYGGGLDLLGTQAVAVVAVFAYSLVVSWILGKVVDATVGFRIGEADEIAGVDGTTHAETGYELGSIAGALESSPTHT